MRLRNAAGTRVSVPEHMAARMLARGWVPAGGERGATPVPPATPAVPDAPDQPPADGQGAPEGVLTLSRMTVPDGSAKDVLDWVGDDRDRATAALEAEQGRGDDARSTLVARLSKLAGK